MFGCNPGGPNSCYDDISTLLLNWVHAKRADTNVISSGLSSMCYFISDQICASVKLSNYKLSKNIFLLKNAQFLLFQLFGPKHFVIK